MPKNLLKRFMPDHHTIRGHRHLQFFGKLLHDPNLFHLNRRSASGGFGVGLFLAFMPVPFQMFFAAAAAIWFRVNMPISVALVWITNPLTMAPIYYFAYKIGAWVLDIPPRKLTVEWSYTWVMQELHVIWQPFLLGCFIISAVSAVIGYFAIRGLWRLRIVRHWQRKKDARAARGDAPPA